MALDEYDEYKKRPTLLPFKQEAATLRISFKNAQNHQNINQNNLEASNPPNILFFLFGNKTIEGSESEK